MSATADLALVGRQTPTYLWIPPHDETLGQEVIELAASCGLVLDPWQQLLVRLICAVDRYGSWLCFEVAVIVSRQNGKGAVLQALELAWLYLFRDELIIHSAHLFETSKEHFLRMQALVNDRDDLRRRVKRIATGRGSEEIELLHKSGSRTRTGYRLKFMSRKGGSGRGFTGNKIVYDEAMYVDATMIAASVPSLAAIRNVQVVYTGSAGLRQSTQLAAVRKRALTRADMALMYAEWAAEKSVWSEDGELLRGDDPASPVTWAKTNPALITRISIEYVGKEMNTLGGPRSVGFGTERLGIGDYPPDDDAWAVIDKEPWTAAADAGSQIVDGSRIAIALDADEDRMVGTIGVAGPRSDGRSHVEMLERHRGTGWMFDATGQAVKRRTPTPAAVVAAEGGNPDDVGDVLAVEAADELAGLTETEKALRNRMVELAGRYTVVVVVVLRTSAAASLIGALERAKIPVKSPTDVEYAQACGAYYEGIVDTRTVVHLDQPSVNAAVAGGERRKVPEGGWRWARSAKTEPGPVIVETLALWGLVNHVKIPRSKVW